METVPAHRLTRVELLKYLTDAERQEMDRLLRARAKWELLPGPQTIAANTPAFETLFGGKAGGGKSELIAWLAYHRHHQALVLRRSFPELERTLIPRMLDKYVGMSQYYNRSDHVWRFPGGKRIDLGYLDSEKDVFRYQGIEIDALFPDELTQFPRDWYLYVFSRIRTTRAGQRTRVLATSNPGGEYEGWVKERWGPWLDDHHPRPAKSGEVRWYRRVSTVGDYAEEEVAPDHDSVGCQCYDRTHQHAWSRTFVLSGENPYLSVEYRRNLDMLPEPYRSQLKDGNWNIGTTDSEWQIIPSEFIRAAQERWKRRAAEWCPEIADKLARGASISNAEWALVRPPEGVPITSYGLDVARGGKDFTAHGPVYSDWFAWPIKYPGQDTPDGKVIVEQIEAMPVKHRHPVTKKTPLNIDILGPGSSPFDLARQAGYQAVAMNGGAGSDAKDKSGLPFANKRAEWYWTMREDLDPNSGANLCLPPHPEVLGDLAAPRYKVLGGKIRVEDKDEIKKRIGRSPDVGDEIVYGNARPQSRGGYGVVGFYGMFGKN